MATHDKDVDFQKVSINHATLLEIAPLFLLSARWRWCAIGDSFLSFFFFFIFNLVLCIDYFSSWFLVSWWSSTSVGITVFIITSTARIWTRIEIFAGKVFFKGNFCTDKLFTKVLFLLILQTFGYLIRTLVFTKYGILFDSKDRLKNDVERLTGLSLSGFVSDFNLGLFFSFQFSLNIFKIICHFIFQLLSCQL